MLQRKSLFPHVIEMNQQMGQLIGCCVYLIHDAHEWILVDIGYEETVDDIIEVIFGTCAVDWPPIDQWEKQLVEGKTPY